MKICKKFVRLFDRRTQQQLAFNEAIPLRYASIRSCHFWTDEHMPWLVSDRVYHRTVGGIMGQLAREAPPHGTLGYNACGVVLEFSRPAPPVETRGAVERTVFPRMDLSQLMLSAAPELDDEWDMHGHSLVHGIQHGTGIPLQTVEMSGSRAISILDIPELHPCFAPGELVRDGIDGSDAAMLGAAHAVTQRYGGNIGNGYVAIAGPSDGPAVFRSSIVVDPVTFESMADNFHLWELSEPSVENYRQMYAGRIPMLRAVF